MPIVAQCRSCAARYKIVDSAAGRRVKCRRCGHSISLPGGESDEPALDLRSIADLERKGQVVATTAEAEYQQYQSNVATLTAAQAPVAKKKDYRSIHDLAGPDVLAKFAVDGKKKSQSSGGGSFMALAIFGSVALAVGAIFLPPLAFVNLIIAALVVTAGQIWGIVVAFLEDAISGTLYLLVPFYCIYFWIKHPYESRGPIRMVASGIILRVLTIAALAIYSNIHSS